MFFIYPAAIHHIKKGTQLFFFYIFKIRLLGELWTRRGNSSIPTWKATFMNQTLSRTLLTLEWRRKKSDSVRIPPSVEVSGIYCGRL